MVCEKGLSYLRLTLLCIPILASPIHAQCKATNYIVPVPGSFADAGATCVAANLVDLGNGTVADRANHLLWQKTPAYLLAYSGFSDFGTYCGGLTLGGRTGWYLPDVAQLQTLLPPGTCHAVMDDCGTGDPDDPWHNSILWANSAVEPQGYYCDIYICHAYMWAVATGLGNNFGVLTEVAGFRPRLRVDARSVDEGNLVRCVADGLKLAIVPDPVKIPAGAILSGGRVLTESRLPLSVTDYVGPVGGVQLTLRSSRPTLDTINGPTSATTSQGLAVAYVQTRNQATGSFDCDRRTRCAASAGHGWCHRRLPHRRVSWVRSCGVQWLDESSSRRRLSDLLVHNRRTPCVPEM